MAGLPRKIYFHSFIYLFSEQSKLLRYSWRCRIVVICILPSCRLEIWYISTILLNSVQLRRELRGSNLSQTQPQQALCFSFLLNSYSASLQSTKDLLAATSFPDSIPNPKPGSPKQSALWSGRCSERASMSIVRRGASAPPQIPKVCERYQFLTGYWMKAIPILYDQTPRFPPPFSPNIALQESM